MDTPVSESTNGVGRRGFLRGAVATTTVAAGATAGTASAQSGSAFAEWFSDVGNYSGLVDRTGEETVEVTVGAQGNGGTFAFAPAAIRVDPGTTVRFVWTSDNHNVVVEDRPAGATWTSHEPIENTGFEFETTFETEGVHLYYCQPHLSLGMKGGVVVGDVEVQESVGGASEGGGGPTFRLPGGEFGAVFMGFLMGSVALIATSVLAGEAYRSIRRPSSGEPSVVWMDPLDGVVNELGHDEYDPTGTASLIVVYFLILAVLWVFMYFIEFLGNGPTVIG